MKVGEIPENEDYFYNREAVVESPGEVESVGNLSVDKEVRQLLIHRS